MLARDSILASLAQFSASATSEWIDARLQAGASDPVTEFLALDLSVTSSPVLSPGNFSHPQFTFSKSALLQVHEILDISLAAPQRLNLEVSPSPTFKILLSDGFVPVVALTKGLFPQLSPALLPGLKLVVKPGVVTRFGVILLESHRSVEFIGGFSPLLIERCQSLLIYDPAWRDPPRDQDAPQRDDPKATPKVPTLDFVPANFLDSDDPIEDDETMSLAQLKANLLPGQAVVRAAVAKYGLLAIRKRAGELMFAMDVLVGDGSDSIAVQASNDLLEARLGTTAGQWLRLTTEEQDRRFGECCKALASMGPTVRLEVRSEKLIVLLPDLTMTGSNRHSSFAHLRGRCDHVF
jgi:hypothetical protein